MSADNKHQEGRRPGPNKGQQQRAKRDPILDLAKYSDKRIRVKFMGGREVTGILKGYDQLLNLVLDETEETMKGGLTPWAAVSQAQPLSADRPAPSLLGQQPWSTVNWVQYGNHSEVLAAFRRNVGLLINGDFDVHGAHFDANYLRDILSYIELDMGQTTNLFQRYITKQMNTAYPQDAHLFSAAYPDLFQHHQPAIPSVDSQIRVDLQAIEYYRPRRLADITSDLYQLVSQGHWAEVNGYFQAFFHVLAKRDLASWMQQLVAELMESSRGQSDVTNPMSSPSASSCILANQAQRLCMYTFWVDVIGQRSSSLLQYYLGNTLVYVTIPRLIGKLIAMKQYTQIMIFINTVERLPNLIQHSNANIASRINYYEVALYGLAIAEAPFTNLETMLVELQQRGAVPMVTLYRCMEPHLWDTRNRQAIALILGIAPSSTLDEASRYYMDNPGECLPLEGRVERGFFVGVTQLFIHEYPYSAAF
ncbi:U6 snRNP-associated protein Lsm7 [Dimargaris xerosporica]|nr:U6 snRNP-associated protein Lsm7 [Dimargaris xerosporica]